MNLPVFGPVYSVMAQLDTVLLSLAVFIGLAAMVILFRHAITGAEIALSFLGVACAGCIAAVTVTQPGNLIGSWSWVAVVLPFAGFLVALVKKRPHWVISSCFLVATVTMTVVAGRLTGHAWIEHNALSALSWLVMLPPVTTMASWWRRRLARIRAWAVIFYPPGETRRQRLYRYIALIQGSKVSRRHDTTRWQLKNCTRAIRRVDQDQARSNQMRGARV